MRIHKRSWGYGVLLAGLLLSVGGERIEAQTAAAQGGTQQKETPARITQAIDENNRVRLQGNVHPLARAEFDQGLAADAQPMNRMLLLLQRSPEQEAALRQLLDE